MKLKMDQVAKMRVTQDKVNDIFEIIWKNDYGLKNIFVYNVDISSVDMLTQFAAKWSSDVNNGGNPSAQMDMIKSVIISPEVAGFSGILDSIPLTFANGVIVNNAIHHCDVFPEFNKGIRVSSAMKFSGTDPYGVAFAKAINTASHYMAACAHSNVDVQVAYTGNLWVPAFKEAFIKLINGLIASGQYDRDLRIIVPVCGLEYHYEHYHEIIRTINDTSIEDKLCYLVFGNKKDFQSALANNLMESGLTDSYLRAAKLLDITFSHIIE